MSDNPVCPHCGAVYDMAKDDNYVGHVSYWGEDEAKAHECGKCGFPYFIQEHVKRWWTSGRTPEEAQWWAS